MATLTEHYGNDEVVASALRAGDAITQATILRAMRSDAADHGKLALLLAALSTNRGGLGIPSCRMQHAAGTDATAAIVTAMDRKPSAETDADVDDLRQRRTARTEGVIAALHRVVAETAAPCQYLSTAITHAARTAASALFLAPVPPETADAVRTSDRDAVARTISIALGGPATRGGSVMRCGERPRNESADAPTVGTVDGRHIPHSFACGRGWTARHNAVTRSVAAVVNNVAPGSATLERGIDAHGRPVAGGGGTREVETSSSASRPASGSSSTPSSSPPEKTQSHSLEARDAATATGALVRTNHVLDAAHRSKERTTDSDGPRQRRQGRLPRTVRFRRYR